MGTMLASEELRNRTSELHTRTEQSVDLDNRCRSRSDYLQLLQRFWGLYVPLESALSEFDWKPVGINFSKRQKLELLRIDMEWLGMVGDEIAALPVHESISTLHTTADAFGCLYVLEGSTLGGQYISARIKERLGITGETGDSFHNAYGTQTGAMWQSFKRQLNDYCSHDEERIEQAVQSAMATFESFEFWLKERADGKSLASV